VALDVSPTRDGDDDVLLGDQVSMDMSPSAAMIRVRRSSPNLLDDLGQLLADDLPLPGLRGQDRLELGDGLLDGGQLVDDLLTLERCQPAQLQVEDGVACSSSIPSSAINPARASSTSTSGGSAR